MPTPPPSGNALIEGVIPLFRMLDAAAAAEPLLMWLVWSMMATALAAVPVVVSRVPSPPVSLLLVVPAALLLVLELTTFLMLLGDLVPLAPLARVAIGLALSATILLVGWACAGALPRPMQSADVTLRLARPMLIASVFLLALALHPFAPRAAIAVLVGAAVFTTEVLLARLLRGALRRGSTATSSADLRPFGCAAPVHVVPDGGLSTLAVAVGEEAETVETVCEPFLLRSGFLARTPRGRIATAKAYAHLGMPLPAGAGQLTLTDSQDSVPR